MKKTIEEVQNNTLNGFSKTLRSRNSEPTLLQKLVAKGNTNKKTREDVVYAGFSTNLTPEQMEAISKKNMETIAALDNKTAPKRKIVMGLAKPKTIAPSKYSETQKGLSNANIPVGETVTINGKTFRKIK